MTRCEGSIPTAGTGPTPPQEKDERPTPSPGSAFKQWTLLAVSSEDGRVYDLFQTLATQDVYRVREFCRGLDSHHGGGPRKNLICSRPRGRYPLHQTSPLDDGHHQSYRQGDFQGEEEPSGPIAAPVIEEAEHAGGNLPGTPEPRGPASPGSSLEFTPTEAFRDSGRGTSLHAACFTDTSGSKTTDSRTASTVQNSLFGDTDTGPSLSCAGSPDRALDSTEVEGRICVEEDIERAEFDDGGNFRREGSIDLEKYWTFDETEGRYFHIDQGPAGPVIVWYPVEFD
ncbi:hypothetical protein MKZ38_006558 [Zalerion maritima]|uniref:Uncharacterized protein n=1 Tax=Zalerion maritima TaxID=339359 RepID=A0AAD5S6J1_9PEZI|nr:hypothetical protein MKZ38_006558 [Zalerion maritima]